MFLDDLVTLLTSAGVGAAGTSIFWTSKAVLPAGDGPYISLRETGGTAPIVMHNSATTPGYQRPSAQILTRATSPSVARTKARDAYNALVQRRNLTVNGVWYMSIDPIQEPFDFGVDEAGRIMYVFNVSTVKRPS